MHIEFRITFGYAHKAAMNSTRFTLWHGDEDRATETTIDLTDIITS